MSNTDIEKLACYEFAMIGITYSATPHWSKSIVHTAKWSALRRIGALPVMRAVMFAPIVAYLILFNDYVFDFLKQVSANIGLPPTDGLGLTNIYFLYYGLIFVGIASIIYSLTCPTSVARFSDSISFARNMEAMNASTIVASHFDDVLEKYIQNTEHSDEKERADYPEETRLLTSRLIIEIYKSYIKNDQIEEFSEENPSDDNDSWQDLHREFQTGSGYFVAEEIAKCVYEPPRVYWGFSEPYLAIAAKDYIADIAFAKYEVDDYSRLIPRLLTTLLYAGGFMLLLIPSISSFISITAALLQ